MTTSNPTSPLSTYSLDCSPIANSSAMTNDSTADAVNSALTVNCKLEASELSQTPPASKASCSPYSTPEGETDSCDKLAENEPLAEEKVATTDMLTDATDSQTVDETAEGGQSPISSTVRSAAVDSQDVGNEQYCLRWNDIHTNVRHSLGQLRSSEHLLDVSLVAQGREVKAHKLVLSSCSPFLRDVLRQPSCTASIPGMETHPIIVLADANYDDIQAILNFMYQGEVNVSQENLSSFLALAEELRVRGLSEKVEKSVCGMTSEDESKETGTTPEQTTLGTCESAPTLAEPRTVSAAAVAGLCGTSESSFVEALESQAQSLSQHHDTLAGQMITATPPQRKRRQRCNKLAALEYWQVNGSSGIADVVMESIPKPYTLHPLGGRDANDPLCHIMVAHSPKGWHCPQCLQVSTTKGNLKSHILSGRHKLVGKSYVCQYCQKSYSTRQSLQVHISNNHRYERDMEYKMKSAADAAAAPVASAAVADPIDATGSSVASTVAVNQIPGYTDPAERANRSDDPSARVMLAMRPGRGGPANDIVQPIVLDSSKSNFESINARSGGVFSTTQTPLGGNGKNGHATLTSQQLALRSLVGQDDGGGVNRKRKLATLFQLECSPTPPNSAHSQQQQQHRASSAASAHQQQHTGTANFLPTSNLTHNMTDSSYSSPFTMASLAMKDFVANASNGGQAVPVQSTVTASDDGSVLSFITTSNQQTRTNEYSAAAAAAAAVANQAAFDRLQEQHPTSLTAHPHHMSAQSHGQHHLAISDQMASLANGSVNMSTFKTGQHSVVSSSPLLPNAAAATQYATSAVAALSPYLLAGGNSSSAAAHQTPNSAQM